MRSYEALWNQLKETKHLMLEAPRDTHATVVRMLRFESSMDLGYRFRCVEIGISTRICHSQIGDLLYVSLRVSDHVTQMFVISPEKLATRRKNRSHYLSKKPIGKV